MANITSDEDVRLTRENRPRKYARFRTTPAPRVVVDGGQDFPVFRPEWFSGDPDIEDNATEENTTAKEEDQMKDTGEESKGGDEEQMIAYPPYLQIGAHLTSASNLEKGSICRSIMRYHSKGLSLGQTVRGLAHAQISHSYSVREIQGIINTCRRLRLEARSPLATASWENESVEAWWFTEEEYSARERKRQPVTKEIAGYDCEDGWWAEKQNAANRDWDLWPSRSIGPQSRTRTQT